MFTGIIQDQGKVLKVERIPEGIKLHIQSQLPGFNLSIGNSIAVNGACLTVESSENSDFWVSLVEETLKMTTHSDVQIGDVVNLEAPLTLQTPIAGQLTSGHVDGVATVVSPAPHLEVDIPEDFVKFCPHKGSICLNGVSLTIAEQNGTRLRIEIIPETMRATNLGQLKVGEALNFEIDLIARYLKQLNT
jgi:riboflavin synthase